MGLQFKLYLWGLATNSVVDSTTGFDKFHVRTLDGILDLVDLTQRISPLDSMRLTGPQIQLKLIFSIRAFNEKKHETPNHILRNKMLVVLAGI